LCGKAGFSESQLGLWVWHISAAVSVSPGRQVLLKIEKGLQRAVEAQNHVPATTRDGLHPVLFFSSWRGRLEIGGEAANFEAQAAGVALAWGGWRTRI
jgi:hypothetical protein